MRDIVKIERKTTETDVSIEFNIDGSGKYDIDTGIPFFDHMLELFTFHGNFDLNIKAKGDIDVDYHHLVEDTGIMLGKAIKESLGDKKGIRRYFSISIPMDEALSDISLDISGREFLYFDALKTAAKIGQFDTELVQEFFQALVNNSEITLHISNRYGRNNHHIAESIFKGFGTVLYNATRVVYPERTESTKWK